MGILSVVPVAVDRDLLYAWLMQEVRESESEREYI